MNLALAIAAFAVLVVLHEAGHFAAAKAVGMRVEKFFLFFPPKVVSVKVGETEYGIGAIPAGGFVKITGMNPEEELPEDIAHRGYYAQPVWKRIVVIAAGPAVNIVLAFAILYVLAFSATEVVATVKSVEDEAPVTGVLKPGDELQAVDGKPGEPRELSDQVNSHRCAGELETGCKAAAPATLTILREGTERTERIRPVYDASRERMRLGFSFGTAPANPGPVQAAGNVTSYMWQVTSRTVSTIARLFESDKRKELSGVVGATEVTRQAIDQDLRTAVFLVAVISLSLGIINLFPFLPLDGGHIFWGIVEKIRGKAVSYATMERSGMIGFVLVIMIFAVGLSNDIGRLTGEGFQLR
ncbi:MAG: M50 family metallopeptidase [Solirubrobacterales bacterium]